MVRCEWERQSDASPAVLAAVNTPEGFSAFGKALNEQTLHRQLQ